MNTPMGEGIMHWYSIADGIDYVYSEIETYYPRYQEQKKLVNYIEIMYMAEGIVFIDYAVQYLNDFFSTDEFTVENFYKEVRETQGCTCIQANERLENLFKDMMALPAEHGSYHRKHVRMQEAKNLLLKEDMSITEIAGACGYANASKFSSAFKDTVGILPGKWRKKSIQNTL